jgi:hypothetical protein
MSAIGQRNLSLTYNMSAMPVVPIDSQAVAVQHPQLDG